MGRYAALRNLYETDKTIGTGGFAKVKLATHVLTGERVAIKIMEKELLGDDLPRVKRELEALKSLSHHYICKLYEIIETDSHFFLVMQYCPGGELFDYIVERSRLCEMDSRSFFRQILSAVAYLHTQGFVHRDIKPENVLLDKDQCVKLIDFGLCARSVQNSYLDTACGSPTYAAPELIKGEKYVGEGVDVWSMGVMLYALLCGRLPFEHEKIDTLYKQIVSGKYVVPDHLSSGSRQVLQDMLQVDPNKRIAVKQLLCHPWVQLGFQEPVTYTSLFEAVEKDVDCINKMAQFYKVSAEELWDQLSANRFDHQAATYQLLLIRKKQGLPLSLGSYGVHNTRSRLQSMRRSIIHKSVDTNNSTYIASTKNEGPTVEKTDKENAQKQMQPPENTPIRVIRKRPRSPNRDASASPAPKRSAKVDKQCVTPKTKQTPTEKQPTQIINESAPNTPQQRPYSPGSRLLSSIERKFKRVRKVLTPQRSSPEPLLPTLLNAKDMCNISTTSSSSPDHVREELLKALHSQGIECKCKGYSIRGKILVADNKAYKLNFELEVCLIPTSANSNGSVVGIRRKRLRGDSWFYKQVCEQVLNMADLT